MNQIQFTQSQQAAVDSFRKFLDGNQRVMILKGAAGTGKTTLVAKFIRILEAQKIGYCLMAPTGRAAYIIGSKTGKPAYTIHRSIYGLTKLKLTVQDSDEEDYGGLHLRFGLKSNNDSSGTVYLVDESSMVSDSFAENDTFSFGSGCLLTDLFEFAAGRKIVFIGDYVQLPPIGMNFSPALDRDYMRRKFRCEVTEVMLREVMRQSGDGVLLQNATRLRDDIEKRSYIEFKLTDGSDCRSADDDLLSPYYQLFPSKPSVSSVVITYSNRKALDYNLAMRRHYYGMDAPRLKPGELLTICRNNYSYNYELFNGNIVQVEACQPDEEVEQRFVKVKMGKDRVESVILRFRKVVIRFGVKGMPVSVTVRILDNFLDDPNGSLGGLLARALIVDFHNRLPVSLKSRLSEIRRWLRDKDRLTVEQKELCEMYTYLLKADPYYNVVICKYGYAMTCHKAQGGEWKNVFVDMGRFGGTANEDYFRWAYTALTRASLKLWHFRSPDFNYISNLVVEKIKQSSNLKVSTYSSETDFMSERVKRLKEICGSVRISVSEERSKAYQHIVSFHDEGVDNAVFQLWYKANGYNGKEVLLSSSSSDFAAMCKGFLEDSFIPTTVPFDAEDRPFAQKLVNNMKSLIEETGIRLLNIVQEQYQDVFHLKTDGLARVGLHYTGKGNYTHMTFLSTLGDQDEKLKALREKFL